MVPASRSGNSLQGDPVHRRRSQWPILIFVLGIGALLFLVQLGSTGLVDETPPLFASAARRMAETGDLLIPRFNGLARYDKPPLVYWLMAAGYALPGRQQWDPLGSWAANLPSALATIALMLLLTETLACWPQTRTSLRGGRPAALAMVGGLSFALSPLVLIWGRTGVSDALLTALLAASLLLVWRCYAAPTPGPWWPAWCCLGLAVLCKGPVAMVLFGLTLILFVALQGRAEGQRLWRRLHPIAGLGISVLVAVPWYGLALLLEGQAYWNSFFLYHNLQRFSTVVNGHGQPLWYFLVVLPLASLPFTPLLLLGLSRAIGRLRWGWPLAIPCDAAVSLGRFSACWLLAVLLFFSLAATKLPSYWLPATPAAALLIALALPGSSRTAGRIALTSTAILSLLLAAGLAAAPLWLRWIEDPTIPDVALRFGTGAWFHLGALLFAISGMLAIVALRRPGPDLKRLLLLQLPLVGVVPALLLPVWRIGDQVRGEPLRLMAEVVRREGRPEEPLAMVGWMKPSLHFYTRRIVLYEGRSPRGLRNLVDRLHHDRREGFRGLPSTETRSVLVVIDADTAASDHWRRVPSRRLAAAGAYSLLRIEHRHLEEQSARLRSQGVDTSWREFRAERW